MVLVLALFLQFCEITTSAANIRAALEYHHNLIVGGENANIEDYPYQVSFQDYGYHFCGGSIVSENYIISAAHCFDELTHTMNVLVGADSSEDHGQVVEIAKVTKHPGYVNETASNDIAIVELKTPLEISESVNTIDLPGEEELEDGTFVNVTGYGATFRKSQRLQVVQVPIVSREKCREAYRPLEMHVGEDMICAGLLGKGGKDSCTGDSGGPLTYNGKLYGIVSWGKGCARPKYPGVYANVVHLLSFIKEVTGLGK